MDALLNVSITDRRVIPDFKLFRQTAFSCGLICKDYPPLFYDDARQFAPPTSPPRHLLYMGRIGAGTPTGRSDPSGE